MPNPYVNKVDLADGTTLIDLTSDTVAADKMLDGYTAHNAAGASVTGSIATKTASDMTVSGKTVTAPAGYYASDQSKDVAVGECYINVSIPGGKTSSGTIRRGKYIRVLEGYHTEEYYVAQGNTGTLSITTADNADTELSCNGYLLVDVEGINVPNEKSFSVQVPNGNSTATFVFTVDSSGNVTITEGS